MVKIFRTDDRIIHEEEQIEPGVLLNLRTLLINDAQMGLVQ